MKTIKRIIVVFFTLFISTIPVLTQENTRDKSDFQVLTGPYFSQKPPDLTPEIFAPGIVSNGFHEGAIAFSPDGDEVYYNIMHLTHGFSAIVFTKLEDGLWAKPHVAAFSGKYNDSDAFFSYDGQKLYFSSDRPLESDGKTGNLDIWVVERDGLSWSNPENLGPPINSKAVDVNPCITRNGTLYYVSNRPGGRGAHDIYRSQLVDEKYTEPENLGDSINTSNFESSPYVDPDDIYFSQAIECLICLIKEIL